ncbi:hypothetical protein [Paraburkholderia hospita]|jgi:hypothetical protein|nr:hypothetical protein SAMN05192544_104286 [Paraburkholderia hospita]
MRSFVARAATSPAEALALVAGRLALTPFGQARAERIHQINDLAGSGHFQLFGRHNLLAGNLLVDSAENALLFLVFVLRRVVVFLGNLVDEL